MKVSIFHCQDKVLVRVISQMVAPEVGKQSKQEDHLLQLSDTTCSIWTPQLLELLECCQQATNSNMNIRVGKVRDMVKFESIVAAAPKVRKAGLDTAAPNVRSSGLDTAATGEKKMMMSVTKEAKKSAAKSKRQTKAAKKAEGLMAGYICHLPTVAQWLIDVRCNGCQTMLDNVRSVNINGRVCQAKAAKTMEKVAGMMACHPQPAVENGNVDGGDVPAKDGCNDMCVKVNYQLKAGDPVYHYIFNLSTPADVCHDLHLTQMSCHWNVGSKLRYEPWMAQMQLSCCASDAGNKWCVAVTDTVTGKPCVTNTASDCAEGVCLPVIGMSSLPACSS